MPNLPRTIREKAAFVSTALRAVAIPYLSDSDYKRFFFTICERRNLRPLNSSFNLAEVLSQMYAQAKTYLYKLILHISLTYR